MSVIMRTTDGGINWNTQETDTLGNINKSFFIDNNNGWIIGGSGGSNLYKTIDGGKTWILKYISDNSSFTDICFSDLNHGVAVGSRPDTVAAQQHRGAQCEPANRNALAG